MNGVCFTYEFRGQPTDIFSAEDWKTIRATYAKFLKFVVSDGAFASMLCSKAVVGIVAHTFGGEDELNTFHQKHPGAIFSVYPKIVMGTPHPEVLHSEELRKMQSPYEFYANCMRYRDIFTLQNKMLFGEDAEPCTAIMDYYEGKETEETKKLAKAHRVNVLEYLIAHHDSVTKCSDESVPDNLLEYAEKNIDRLGQMFAIDSAAEATLRMLHRVMAAKGREYMEKARAAVAAGTATEEQEAAVAAQDAGGAKGREYMEKARAAVDEGTATEEQEAAVAAQNAGGAKGRDSMDKT